MFLRPQKNMKIKIIFLNQVAEKMYLQQSTYELFSYFFLIQSFLIAVRNKNK